MNKMKFKSPRFSSPATESINEPNVGGSAATGISTCALYPSQQADALTGNGSNKSSNLLTL
jgi:hypothetical protein